MGINDFLEQENLGRLSGVDLRHAFGTTSKGYLVWLPQINDNEHWINVVLANDGIIVQLPKIEGNKKEPGIWDAAIVITRDEDNPKDEYKRLPDRYRPVYRNANISLTIHAKENLPIAQGDVIKIGNNSWVKGFAETVDEALEKEKMYRKKARLQ